MDLNPGRRSQTRFTRGCHLSGFQPFQSAGISVYPRFNALRLGVFALNEAPHPGPLSSAERV